MPALGPTTGATSITLTGSFANTGVSPLVGFFLNGVLVSAADGIRVSSTRLTLNSPSVATGGIYSVYVALNQQQYAPSYVNYTYYRTSISLNTMCD